MVTSVNAKLKVSGSGQTIQVESTNAAVQTETGEISQTIGVAEVQDIPYDSLDPYVLATTLPGVSTVTSGLYNFTNDTNGTAFSSNGERARGNNFLIEGQDNNDASLHGQGLQPENFEAIQEVTVLLNSTSAEYGHGGGAISNLIYKSGTNSLHGSAWDRLSNSSLDANDHANVLAGIPKTKYRENIFGFTLGGPLKKDKLFFFTSYQWDNYRSSANGGDLILPTAAGYSVLQQYAPRTRGSPRCWRRMAVLRGNPTRSGAPAPIPLGLDSSDGLDRGSVPVGLFNRIGVPLDYDSPEFDAKGDYIITRNDTLNLRYIRTSFNTPYDFFNFPNNLPGFDSEPEWSLAERRRYLHPHLQSDSAQRSPRFLWPHGTLVSAARGQRSGGQHGDDLHCRDAGVGRESSGPAGPLPRHLPGAGHGELDQGQALPQDGRRFRRHPGAGRHPL